MTDVGRKAVDFVVFCSLEFEFDHCGNVVYICPEYFLLICRNTVKAQGSNAAKNEFSRYFYDG